MPQVYQYPGDLGVSLDLLHYVMFFINVRSNTVNFVPGTGLGPAPIQVIPGGAGGPIPGQVGIDRLGTLITGGGIGDGPILGITGAAAGAAGLTGSNQTVRLDTVIALHVDEKPSVTYSAKYNEVDHNALGMFAQLLAGEGSASDYAKKLGGVGVGMLATLASTPMRAFPGGLDSLSAIAKVRMNPFRQAFFDHMDFRMFRFRYRFFPSTPEESLYVRRIIELFKFHMHPELAGGTAWMLYPSEFDIVYMYNGQENRWLHRISTCVLAQMSVDYGGENFSSFDSGAPAEVYLNLVFREVSPLTKERILDGY